MMPKQYIAVTYDVCEHNDLCEDMNEYILNSSVDMDKQIKDFAKRDVAPLVKVYESVANYFKESELALYKEYIFKEYERGCNQLNNTLALFH